MTTPFTASIIILLAVVSSLPPSVQGLGGSAATVAVVYGSATTICTIIAQQPIQQIQCWQNGQLLPPITPTVSFDYIAGGRDTLCATRSGGFILLCWNTTFISKRLYNNYSAPLTSLTIGDTQICGLTNITSGQNVICWRGNDISVAQSPNGTLGFRTISSGLGFSCGVLENTNQVLCWGDEEISRSIQSEFSNNSMLNIQVGGRHACGIDTSGFVICKGNNESGQLNVPSNSSSSSSSSYEYSGLALGSNHSCAIRRLNRTVVCWGEISPTMNNITDGISFESIVAGLNFTCGLTTTNFSVICWGPGWPNSSTLELPLQRSLPGPCVETPCECNVYPQSQLLCSGNGNICRPCDVTVSVSPPGNSPLPPPPSPRERRTLRRGLLAFAIVGSIGGFAGICTVIYCLWTGVCFGKKKIHNSVQPTITRSASANAGNGLRSNSNSSSNPPSRSSTLRRQGSILMRRQRSGTSSKHADKAEEFPFSELAMATNDFALENKIGAGSFGVVYRGKLSDGRQVAIKRSEMSKKKFQEKESAFESELAFLSRLHHKHLVRLVGYCEERDERLLVYEYMKNGALYDHLHDKNNTEKSSSFVNSWRTRIKISLDAARGIEYLHNYAVPPIIHRDIKSSNILLDATWTARVSDFGLSLMGHENDSDHGHRPMKAAGTVGYIDPEYYGLNVLTAKSDVYGLGVVLLELLTGKRALFKKEENGGAPISLVDYAVPAIMAGELDKILDPRVGRPEMNESEAVELVAYTAMHCVHLEGKDRPSMSDIVANLERALVLCDDNISSSQISIVSD